ncbi:methionine aminotransferase [Leeuwenhoekiella sp. H156]|uniref:methionine aminotransferase n=1 Tax=Leeuwenhoekiella sp. H156 TaxID=3450128 RepID=UPI003FA44641
MQSKLPGDQASIFAEMTGLAVEHNALNLSQGFPGFSPDPVLIDLVSKAMRDGYNQYAPPAGHLRLREKISELIADLRGKIYDPEHEINLTVGASEALYVAITAFVHPADEVIVLKPAFDSYEPTIKLQGATPVPVQLEAPYLQIDWNAVANAITSKTRMIIINNPHNPGGMVFKDADLKQLESIVRDTNILILSDEVYEHMVFDGRVHRSAASYPGIAERALITASFGKTFHTTGWKMGYCLAPKDLMREFRKVHQNLVFSIHHPTQIALAQYLEEPKHYLGLSEFYQAKRDTFLNALNQSRFTYTPAEGAYFQIMDYSAITDEPAVDFAKRLTREHKLASIPVSVFNVNHRDDHLLRFCFAKAEKDLLKAAEILNSI